MSTSKSYWIEVSGIRVEVVRKNIKHLHLGVYPPEGRVRVSVPLHVHDETVRMSVITHLAWICRKQAEFQRQERQTARHMVTGESHYVQGKRYLLHVIEHHGPPYVRICNNKILELHVRPGTDGLKREAVLHAWYRQRLSEHIPDIIARWEPIIGVKVAEWRIKKMKTRWGTCNSNDRRIWINLELAKKPLVCLEYIIVHEMVHLLERYHNARFKGYMDRFIPQWRHYRDMLNEMPLAHEEWAHASDAEDV